MKPVSLRFVETVRGRFPVTTQGSGTAMTCVIRSNDPYVAFLTQVPGDDTLYFLNKSDLTVNASLPNPPGRANCTGMGFDPLTRSIIMAFPLNGIAPNVSADQIVAVNPITGVEIGEISAPRPSFSPGPGSAAILYEPQGIATNGILIARASDFGNGALVQSSIELFTRSGFPLGQTDFSGRRIRGISSSPWSWSYIDQSTHEIVVLGPFGNEIATAPGVGSPGNPADPARPVGMGAIAFDSVAFRHMEHEPQEWLPGGILGARGTINHPDTPWSPEPWGGRHKLYVANETDQMIYGGYLTAQ